MVVQRVKGVHALWNKAWNARFGLGLPPAIGLRQSLQWLMLARLAGLYLALTAIVLQQIFRREALSDFQICLSYALLALSFGFNLFFSALVEVVPSRWWLAAGHLVFDALVISSWLVFSGSQNDLFASFYLLQILIVSLILYQKGGLFASALSCVCYAVVIHFNPPLGSNPWINWLIFSGVFFTLGIVGGYLSEELLRTSLIVSEKQSKIEKLTAIHESIISNMPTGLLTVDSRMNINFINPAAEHILGQTHLEIFGKPLSEVEPGLLPFFSHIETEDIAEPEVGPNPELVIESTATGHSEKHRTFFVENKLDKRHSRLQQRVEIGVGKNAKILRGDVADLDLEAGLGKLLDPKASSGRVLLFQEVTKLLHLEERLRQNEKLAAVGQLAAGIAHEIRNPLASMSASIEMLKDSLPPHVGSVENQKLMDIAIREIDRLNRLISEFLDFVKPDKIKPEPVVLSKLLSDVVLAVRQTRSAKFTIQFNQLFNDDAVASGSSEKIKQVALNLLINAVQAMRGDGVIEVGCMRIAENRVRFWVEDGGLGMSEEVLAHLYEPFFTTKEKGTGLGLATAYKIIEAHLGEIRVTSQVNRGSKFEVFLPAHSGD